MIIIIFAVFFMISLIFANLSYSSYLHKFHDSHDICNLFMISIIFQHQICKIIMMSIRFAKFSWSASDLHNFHDQQKICTIFIDQHKIYKVFMISIRFTNLLWWASYLQNFHDQPQVCKIFMMSIRFAQFFLISIRFAKGHSLHHMLRGSAEGVVCANNGHLIRRYYQAAHFCQTNSRLFLHWKTFRTSSNKPSFAAEIFLGAHYDNINFVNKQDYFLK